MVNSPAQTPAAAELSAADLVALDWGTSSLRVWALTAAGEVRAERRSAEGMGTLAPGQFEGVLRRHLDGLRQALAGAPRPLPVIACGMVGARQGWREAPYVGVPADVGAVCGGAIPVPAEGLDLRILPGLAVRGTEAAPEDADVMRGEETQLLGLLQAEPALSGLVCLPGTHSKWVRLEAGRVTGFRTAMTGELFALLCRHSVLRHGLGEAGAAADPDQPGFERGLARGLAAPERLTGALFGVRGAALLHGVTGAEAAASLSGLLIGAEIGGAGLPAGAPVVVLADGALAALYARALGAAGHPVRAAAAGEAARRGLLHAARRIWPGLEREEPR